MRIHVGLMLTALVVCLPVAGAAEGPKPFPEFTFKRIAPPAAGSGRRITVQIEEPAPELATAEPGQEPETAPEGTGLAYDWYWSVVSPKLEDSGPGRLQAALDGLVGGPQGNAVAAPPLQNLTEIASAYGTDILLATVGTRVSPALVLAVIAVESAGRAGAVSGAGATGLMQLMPDTATRFGVTDATDAVDNINGGVAYLDWLMGKFAEDPVLVLAGYNAGENAIFTHSGVPPYAETRGYVPKVLAAWGVARGLCMTPPDLVTDGCVFAVPARSNG